MRSDAAPGSSATTPKSATESLMSGERTWMFRTRASERQPATRPVSSRSQASSAASSRRTGRARPEPPGVAIERISEVDARQPAGLREPVQKVPLGTGQGRMPPERHERPPRTSVARLPTLLASRILFSPSGGPRLGCPTSPEVHSTPTPDPLGFPGPFASRILVRVRRASRRMASHVAGSWLRVQSGSASIPWASHRPFPTAHRSQVPSWFRQRW